MTIDRALIVGVGSEIGTAIAVALASEDVVLELWGFDSGRLRRALRSVEAAGGHAVGRSVDLRDPGHVRDAVATLTDVPLRWAVWTPGVFDWAHAAAADPDRWSQVIDVGLTAAARWAAHIAPLLAASPPSRLLFLGSLAGRRIFANNAAYIAAKHGIDALARALAEDLEPRGVGVTVLAPSVVDAGAGRRAPSGPRLRPSDVGSAARWVLTLPSRVSVSELVLTSLPPSDPVESSKSTSDDQDVSG